MRALLEKLRRRDPPAELPAPEPAPALDLRYEAPAHFRDGIGRAIVLSAGRTATQWLAAALNFHDRALFAHGLDLDPVKKASEADYTADLDRLRAGINTFDWSQIDDYFDRLTGRGGYQLYGNIHGLRPEWVRPNLGSFRHDYRICALIRHPVLRTQSFVNRWTNNKFTGGKPRSLDGYLHPHVLEACARHRISPEDRVAVFFINAAGIVLAADRDNEALGVPFFPVERVTCDINYTLALMDYLSAGLLDLDASFVSRVMSLRPIDQTATDPTTAAAPLLFKSWAPWQRAFFIEAVDSYGVRELYQQHGYALPR